MAIRLNRFLALAGAASRRGADALIQEGAVAVNGKVVAEPGGKVDPATDAVTVRGRRVSLPSFAYFAYYKPRGILSTKHDERGRSDLSGVLAGLPSGVTYCGRLDRKSEGLMILTNDGDLANRLMHPRYGVEKVYVAVVPGAVTKSDLASLVRGVTVDGEVMKATGVEAAPGVRGKTRLTIALVEGKNREVRRMLEAIGKDVARLIRIRIGPVEVGALKPGEMRPLTKQELARLGALERYKPPPR